MNRFKTFVKGMIEEDKLQWQEMCSPLYKNFSINELRKVAKVEGIPYYTVLNKRELCYELSLRLTQAIVNAKTIRGKCVNRETLSFDDIEDIPAHRLYPMLSSSNTDLIYCFDIDELNTYIDSTNRPQNPYTRESLHTDQIDNIREAFRKYKAMSTRVQQQGRNIEERQRQQGRNIEERQRQQRQMQERREDERRREEQALEERIARYQAERQNNYTLSDWARLGNYTRLENVSNEDLLREDEYGRSLYYYLVFSGNTRAINWLLSKDIEPPENILSIANRYKSQFKQKISQERQRRQSETQRRQSERLRRQSERLRRQSERQRRQ